MIVEKVHQTTRRFPRQMHSRVWDCAPWNDGIYGMLCTIHLPHSQVSKSSPISDTTAIRTVMSSGFPPVMFIPSHLACLANGDT